MLVREVIEEARACGLPLTVSTAKINPARNLYERLGFVVTHESEFKVFMEMQWRRVAKRSQARHARARRRRSAASR